MARSRLIAEGRTYELEGAFSRLMSEVGRKHFWRGVFVTLLLTGGTALIGLTAGVVRIGLPVSGQSTRPLPDDPGQSIDRPAPPLSGVTPGPAPIERAPSSIPGGK